jgi:hypothetical protein
MTEIVYGPDVRTPYFVRVYNHDARSPVYSRSRHEVVEGAEGLLYWARYLAASDKASLEAAADDIRQRVIEVREELIGVSLVIGLPVGGELTTPGLAIPI